MVAQKSSKRDIEKNYPVKQFVKKLRRLADCIEQSQIFRIQVAGERISVPSTAIINIEHERDESSEEVEFQFKWLIEKGSAPRKVKDSQVL
jgi:amphi-Trp domain-containing protein